jgi:hypothetical protein
MKSFINFLLLTLVFTSCNTIEIQDDRKLTLTFEDASCTEVWLTLKMENITLPAAITIKQNNQTRSTINLATADTLLYIDSLLPNRTYSFKAELSIIRHPIVSISSNEVSATTLDTTSHNFTWQTWTFGEAGVGSSALYDVAIIDENNIWAVGAIYLKDSLGNPDPHAYNSVHWNGKKWELKKINFYTICGQTHLTTFPAKSIFVLNENEIWIAMDGDQIAEIENEIQKEIKCLPWSFIINKMWSTAENLYFVGNNGFIVNWDLSSSWQKIESGTDLDIQDIWGFNNPITNEREIYCIACNKYQAVDKKVYKITNNKAIEITNEGLPWSISSVWFDGYKYYIVGDGIFVKDYPGEKWNNITGNITPYYSHYIRGNAKNDLVVVGSFGDILHFNGLTWKGFRNNGTPAFTGNYYSVAMKGNTICSVGQVVLDGNKAVITLGSR